MCGSLRRERYNELAGHPVPKVTEGTWISKNGTCTVLHESGKEIQARFLGHSRSENLQNWLAGGWQLGRIKVGAFTEGHPPRVFPVPGDKTIQVVMRVVNVRGEDTAIFHIVTRPAAGEEEKQVHPRFPVLVDL